MGPLDPTLERMFLGIARALFMNRLHVLRLTEVIRLHIEPDQDDKSMDLPPEVDNELKQQAIDYVLTCFPEEFSPLIQRVMSDWLRPA